MSRSVRAVRWTLGPLAVAAIAFGGWGLTHDQHHIPLWPVAQWLIGALLIHDVLIAPLTFGVGLALARLLPSGPRTVVRVALTVAAALTIVALPLILAKGASSNPTVLPLDYRRHYLLLLATLAAVTLPLTLAAAIHHHLTRPRR